MLPSGSARRMARSAAAPPLERSHPTAATRGARKWARSTAWASATAIPRVSRAHRNAWGAPSIANAQGVAGPTSRAPVLAKGSAIRSPARHLKYAAEARASRGRATAMRTRAESRHVRTPVNGSPTKHACSVAVCPADSRRSVRPNVLRGRASAPSTEREPREAAETRVFGILRSHVPRGPNVE
jgi:hypothetical protein